MCQIDTPGCDRGGAVALAALLLLSKEGDDLFSIVA